MNFIARIFSKAGLLTILRYALVVIGTALAGAGKMEPGSWETISGAILTIAGILAGASDSGTSKVNVDGKSVSLAKLPSGLQTQIETAVQHNKSRSWLDILLGK